MMLYLTMTTLHLFEVDLIHVTCRLVNINYLVILDLASYLSYHDDVVFLVSQLGK